MGGMIINLSMPIHNNMVTFRRSTISTIYASQPSGIRCCVRIEYLDKGLGMHCH
jgi:hypothetical protein